MERATGPNTSLGGILGHNGTYFMKRGAGERTAFSFEHHMLSKTKAHVTARETLRRHVPTPRDRHRDSRRAMI